MTAEKFFERQIVKAQRSLEQADRRGDEGAVTGIRRKLEFYREAVRALREFDAHDRLREQTEEPAAGERMED